jgi:carbonic anhydrase
VQSPVNFADAPGDTAIGISTMTPAIDRLWYKYPPVGYPLRLVNDGHTVGVTLPETYKGGLGVSAGQNANEMLQDANFFRAWKLTVHHPAEHKLHGQAYPLELQLAHQNPATQQTGILAVWVEAGEPSKLFDTLLEGGLPDQPYTEVNFNTRASPISMARSADPIGLPLAQLMQNVTGATTQDGVFAYEGSLTEPPCEEGVRWWVRRTPVKASLEQIAKLTTLITKLSFPLGNARVLQKVGSRSAELMTVVDPASDAELPPPVAPAPDGIPAPGPEAICSQLKEYASESAFDSEEVKLAKREYALAAQQATSARIWVANAKAALSAASGVYDGEAGLVAKINQKWDVIAKQSELENAVAQMQTAVAAEAATCDKTLPAVCGASDSEECKNALGTLPPADAVVAVAAPNATNGTNETGPQVHDTGLNYQPKVILPAGAAGNPFGDRIAERASRIGETGMPVGVRDLSASLRQPLSPHVAIPSATLLEEPTRGRALLARAE